MSISFTDGYNLPIGQHTEKKNKFSYLSWAFAVRYLRENYPEATWVVHESSQGVPYFPAVQGYMVKVSVFVDGLEFPQWHPILNHANKTIPDPDAFQINTAIQRCLVKAIGLATGIGLALYAGEDLRTEDAPHQEQKKELTPDNKVPWANAIVAYKRDGNFDKIEARMTLSDENKERIRQEAAFHQEAA